jgi:tetratricopeptide (TPR) repeat protein
VRYIFISLLAFLISCGNQQDQKINVPVVSQQFYRDALVSVSLQYQENPTDDLLRQKLFYFEKLGWPKDAIIDLNEFMQKHGLDRNSVILFSKYYMSNDMYVELIALLDKWERFHGLDEEFSQFRIVSKIKANGNLGTKELMENYLSKFNSVKSYEFLVRQSLLLEDSTLQYDLLSKLSDIAPENQLVGMYLVPNLIEQGDFVQALIILNENSDRTDFTFLAMRAKVLYHLDSTEQAKSILRAFSQPKASTTLAQWFYQEKNYDSAIFYVNKSIQSDSSRINFLLKGDIYERKDAFELALNEYYYLLKVDSTDNIAREKASNVERKIAYLRNLKEKARKAPVLELKPKKVIK